MTWVVGPDGVLSASGPSRPRFVFGASEFVSRMNTDVGQRVWQQISPDLTEGTRRQAHPAGARQRRIRHWSHPKWLFIATDVGVFRTTNLGKTWIKVGANLPLVPVNDIDLPAGSDTLYAATYGRRVWTTSLADIS